MPDTTSGARRVQRRDRLRAMGLLPRATGFAAECERQSRLVRDAAALTAKDDEAWWAVSDTTGWVA